MLHPDNVQHRHALPRRDAAVVRLAGFGVRLVAMMTIITMALAGPAVAQDGTAPAAPAAAPDDGASDLAAPRVDWSHGMKMHRLIETWMGRGNAAAPPPDQLDPRELPVLVTDLVGVRVTLRFAGRRMGIGDIKPHEVKRDVRGVVDLVATVRLATQRAMFSARQAIARQNEIARKANEDAGKVNPRPPLDQVWLMENMQADLQIGHRRTAIQIRKGDPPQAIFETFSNGYHGLIMTGKAVDNKPAPVGVLWPATALAANMKPNGQLLSLLSAVDLGQGQLPLVARPDGPELERFHCIHIVRSARNEPRQRLIRGQVVLPRAFNVASLSAMSDRLSAHLKKRIDVKKPGAARGMRAPRGRGLGNVPQIVERPIRSVYLPSRNEFKPGVVTANELTFASYALSHRAKVLSLVNREGADFADTLTVARTAVVRSEGLVILDGQAAPSARAMGLLTLALLESPQFGNRKDLRTKLTGKILRLQGDDGRFRNTPLKNARHVEPATQAILAAALAAVYERNRDKIMGQAAAEARDAAWILFQTRPVPNHSTFYWLLLAEQKLATLEETPRPAAKEEGQPLNRLQRQTIADRFIKFLLAHQIAEAPDADLCPSDILGGFDLADRLPGLVTHIPKPDWRSANVLAGLSIALRKSGMVSKHQRPDLLLHCSLSGRYVAQLMVDTPSTYYMKDPAEALGGVRQALDNNELSLTATATALIAVTELQQSIHEMEMEQNK